jgi:hypothetical protein
MFMGFRPYFQIKTGAVHFLVPVEGELVSGCVTTHALRGLCEAGPTEQELLAAYVAHQDLIDAAVARRVAEGSDEPVTVRGDDL